MKKIRKNLNHFQTHLLYKNHRCFTGKIIRKMLENEIVKNNRKPNSIGLMGISSRPNEYFEFSLFKSIRIHRCYHLLLNSSHLPRDENT